MHDHLFFEPIYPKDKRKKIIMHTETFLHKLLWNVTHKKRIITLALLTKATLLSKQLSVTKLGRAIDLPIQERSCIRRADRLIGNKKLHADRKIVHKEVVRLLVGTKTRPIILVDWSNIPNSTHNTLRAAIVTSGRALTLYEEVHPLKKLGNRAVHNNFLDTLKQLLEANCKPIIVTDAGFNNWWFKKVIELQWDYVGRIRGDKNYQLINMDKWQKIDVLSRIHVGEPKGLGKAKICKENTILSNLYVTKEKVKFRLRARSRNKRGDRSVCNHRRSAKEALIVISSLSGRTACKKVIALYKHRMQIEEAFRDLKSTRFGFGFEHSYSKSIARIEILLLIAMLASMIAWLIGLFGETMNLQYRFQVNSTKHRRVLSLFFLGCQMIKRKIKIPINVIEIAIKHYNGGGYVTM